MSEVMDVGGLFEDGDRAIVHPDRTIGDSVEVTPGNAPGLHGPLREIIRTRGADERAQLLTVTVVGSGIYESSLRGASSAPRGPLVGVLEWGVRGARAKAEFDIPQGGVVLSVVASFVTLSARYDGLILVNGQPLDPAAVGAPHPGPAQRVAAMVGYGAYGPSARLTRTLRLNDIVFGSAEAPDSSPRIRVPPFARRVLLAGQALEQSSYRVRFGAVGVQSNGDSVFALGTVPRALDLPGDCAFIEVQNLGPGRLSNPTLLFELGL